MLNVYLYGQLYYEFEDDDYEGARDCATELAQEHGVYTTRVMVAGKKADEWSAQVLQLKENRILKALEANNNE